ncbi:MAG: sulfatase-like hydrolase/transferase [Saprospiraceae bacterium]
MLHLFEKNSFYLLLLLIVLFSCNKEREEIAIVEPEEMESNEMNPDVTTTTQPNILFIIADDMGKDATAGFSEGTIKPNTPNLNSIKDAGLTFNNFWTYPTCSPTRASIITGKYGYRTGVKFAGDVLDTSEKILQQYINEQTNNAYATAIVGKWHLAGRNSTTNLESLGMDYYAGVIAGSVSDYYDWDLSEDGASTSQTGYTTEVFTDLAIDWVNDQDKPWFLWLAYNAPHTPFHVPPADMHTQGNLPTYADNLDGTPYYMAAIEAMDYQIGRLLANIPDTELDNTIIIFIGDNGTPGQVAQAPYSRRKAKGSLYQGGVNVPMFISGKNVSRMGAENSLIGSTDLYSTIAALAGVDNSTINDSKSFKNLLTTVSPHRDFQYAELSDGENDLWGINNGEYKLIVNANGTEELYDLGNDPYESENLLNSTLTATQESAKVALETALGAIRN